MPDPIRDLVVYVNEAMMESKFPIPCNGYFASRKTLTAITESSVIPTIWPTSLPDMELVEFISRQARELFAIGIVMDIGNEALVDLMRLFMREEKTDSSLPISEDDIMKMWPRPRDSMRRRHFRDFQYLFRAPTFARRDRFSVISLKMDTVLPIVESTLMSQGRFSIVYRVRLHEDFLGLDDPIRKVRRYEHSCRTMPSAL